MKLEIECQPLEEDDSRPIIIEKARQAALKAFDKYLEHFLIDSAYYLHTWTIGVKDKSLTEILEKYTYEGRY